jgi:hypothetical protein
MYHPGIQLSSLQGPLTALHFPKVSEFHPSATGMNLILPFPVHRIRQLQFFISGITVLDGRTYRIQGWLSRIHALEIGQQALLISIKEPVLVVARLQNRSARDLDWVEGLWNVGHEGLLSSGRWRIFPIVEAHTGSR